MKTSLNITQRYMRSKALHVGVCVVAFISALPLVLILGKVFVEGIKFINWQFLTQPPPLPLKQ